MEKPLPARMCRCQTANSLGRGFFYEDKGGKTVWGRVSVDGQNIEAQLRRSKFHRQQQTIDVSNRFFWVSRNGVVHVCTCRRSKREREKALQHAKHLLSAMVGTTPGE